MDGKLLSIVNVEHIKLARAGAIIKAKLRNIADGSVFVFFSSRRRHTRFDCDWSSDVCSSDLFAILAACLLVVGAATLLRGLFLSKKIEERDDFEMHTRHKVAAVGIGATTGFVDRKSVV